MTTTVMPRLRMQPASYSVMFRHGGVTILSPFHFRTFAAAEEYRKYLVQECGCEGTRTLPDYPGREP